MLIVQAESKSELAVALTGYACKNIGHPCVKSEQEGVVSVQVDVKIEQAGAKSVWAGALIGLADAFSMWAVEKSKWVGVKCEQAGELILCAKVEGHEKAGRWPQKVERRKRKASRRDRNVSGQMQKAKGQAH